MKYLILAALGVGAYLWYQNYTATHAGALPADASAVQQMNIGGVPVTVYLASTGYYAQYPSGSSVKTLGPYSQAQVSAILNAKSAFGNIL